MTEEYPDLWDLKENNFSTKFKTWQKTAARTCFSSQFKFYQAQIKPKTYTYGGVGQVQTSP